MMDKEDYKNIREMTDIILGNTYDTISKENYKRLESLSLWIGHAPEILKSPNPSDKNDKNDKNFDDSFETDLFEADPNCEHEIVDAIGGGVKCKHCNGWFCF